MTLVKDGFAVTRTKHFREEAGHECSWRWTTRPRQKRPEHRDELALPAAARLVESAVSNELNQPDSTIAVHAVMVAYQTSANAAGRDGLSVRWRELRSRLSMW